MSKTTKDSGLYLLTLALAELDRVEETACVSMPWCRSALLTARSERKALLACSAISRTMEALREQALVTTDMAYERRFHE